MSPIKENAESKKVESPPVSTPIIDAKQMLVSLLSGIVFGVAIDRAQLNLPFTIIQQLEFQNFTMMRMFLAASATSAVSITLSHSLGIYHRIPKPGTSLGFGLMKGYGGNVLGGLLLGIGMGLSGACPGTVYAQLGADPGLRTGLIIAGGLCGVITFGYVENLLSTSCSGFLSKVPDSRTGNQSLLNIMSLGAAVAMLGILLGLNKIMPWESQMNKILDQGLTSYSNFVVWDPLIAGITVGLLQFPSILSSNGSFGMSSGWVLPAYQLASIVDSKIEENAPYLRKYANLVSSNWQFVSSIGAFLGSFLSSHAFPHAGLSNDAFNMQNATSYLDFIGGFLLLFGARIGGGCTSGHGLSGMGMCSSSSVVSVVFMFAGGMATRALMQLYPNTL